MVLPSEVTIKHEKEDFDHDSDDYLTPEFEVTVKVEVESSHVTQWEVKTEFINDQKPNCIGTVFEDLEENFCGVDYEELIEYILLKCTICNEEFYERYSFLRHNLKHLKLHIKPLKNIHRCPSCLCYYPTKKELTKHVVSTHKNNSKKVYVEPRESIKVSKMLHQCKICGKIHTYKTWHSHMREVHGTEEYECNICNAVFKCARYLQKHFYSIHLNKKFKGYSQTVGSEIKCSLCPAILRCKNALVTHTRNCHGEKAQCRLCSSVLKSQSYLNTHMRRVHYNDGKEHKCFCGKKFQSPRYLKVHMKNAHQRR